MNLKDSIQFLKGVGPTRAEALKSVEVETIEDLLYYVPRRYLDRSTITPIKDVSINSQATVIGQVEAYGMRYSKKWRGKNRFQVIIRDKTSFINLVWFEGIRFVKNKFKEGDLVVASGEVRFYDGLQIAHPEFEIISKKGEDLTHTGRIIPLYPSTAQLKKVSLDSRGIRKILKLLLDKNILIEDVLPQKVISSLNLLPLNKALRNVHFPETLDLADRARERLAFDELFFLELLLALRKNKDKNTEDGIQFDPPGKLVRELLKILSFELTDAQKKVLREITNDMTSKNPMNRLLQGDVGSGKTVVALFAMLIAIESGYQAALMAPTEILAEQHYLTIHNLFESLGIEIALLTSSVTQLERKEILKRIELGLAKVAVGTHALIEEKVKFFNLGFVVIDEQHRFGVLQRARLKKKGESPDLLVMTATPIPRTLALTLYGDMEVSTLDQLPPGRKQIKTSVSEENSQDSLYRFLDEEIEKKNQAYIVYPLVEESEVMDLKAATQGYEYLQKEVFPNRRIALLHGRIKSQDREMVMRGFRNKDYDILVCTTVIEVGLDVPDATVMIIEHPERFGLSQLHQLRGRIGRSEKKSFCFLKVSAPLSTDAKKRLSALCSSNDGFKIAEWDLKLRGPGEFLGTRQHGLPRFKIADLTRDLKLLYQARDKAFEIVGNDPDLKNKENSCLKRSFLFKYKEKERLLEAG